MTYGNDWCKKYIYRSVANYGVRYTGYYGDGDSKSFNEVENIYPGIKVQTFHCIGHYQKGVGNKLRKLKTRVKGLGGSVKKQKEQVIDGRIVTAKVLKGLLTDTH